MKIVRKALQILVWLYFLARALNNVLPSVLAEYPLFERFYWAYGHVSNAVTVLAVALFLLTLIPVRQREIPSLERKTLILHDCDPEAAHEIFSGLPNTTFYCATPKMAACKGFYDCWLRTPGTCSLHDGFEGLGREIGVSDEFIIVTKSLYGGYSKEIKNALDRSISFALPYFKMVEWEVHHQERFPKRGNLTVYVYDSESMSDYDKGAFHALVKANVRNMHKNEPRVKFVGDLREIKEWRHEGFDDQREPQELPVRLEVLS